MTREDSGEPRFALILERGSPKPDAEIGRLLAYHLSLHPTDSILRVRYGGGLILEDAPEPLADDLARRLLAIGVRTRKVPAGEWALSPRGFRAFALEFGEDSLAARLVGGRRVGIPRTDVFALNVYALSEGKSTPAALKGGAAAERGVLSERGRRLLENLAALEGVRVEFHMTLHCADPVGPVRVRRNDFDFTCLGVNLQEHSLDNFLFLLEETLRYLPDAWNREPAVRFLEDLDPQRILCFKEEEAGNLDRWLLQWVRIETEARAAGCEPGGAAP